MNFFFRQKNPNADELFPLYTEIYLSHFKVRGKSQKDFLNTLENLAILNPQPILKPILKPLIMDIIQMMYKLDILTNFDCDHSDFLQKAARVGLDPQNLKIGSSRVGLALKVKNSGQIGSGWSGSFGRIKSTTKVENVSKNIQTLTLDENPQRSQQRAGEPKPKYPTFEGCSFMF